MIKFKVWRCGEQSGFSRWALNVITRAFGSKRQRDMGRREKGIGAIALKTEEEATGQEIQGAHQTPRFSLQSLVDVFRPVTLILDP